MSRAPPHCDYTIERRLARIRMRAFVAREMALVDLAEATLAALLVNLEIEHPTLVEIPVRRGPPSLQRARTLTRLIRQSLDAMVSYRRAVDDAIFDTPPTSDSPF